MSTNKIKYEIIIESEPRHGIVVNTFLHKYGYDNHGALYPIETIVAEGFKAQEFNNRLSEFMDKESEILFSSIKD